MSRLKKPTIAMAVIGAVGVLIAVLAREPVVELSGTTEPPKPVVVKLPPPPRPSPEEIAKPHLAWAEQESARVIEEHIKTLDAFFAESKQYTRAFADKALGWSSKWRLVVDKVPFTRGGRHEKFIRQKFEEYIFTPAQLEAAVKQVVGSYLTHIRNIEGKMLVKIRMDVADFSSSYILGQIDEGKLHAAFEGALAQVISTTNSDLRADVATELVSLITGEVLTQVAVRLGVSAGILGAGAASSWATLGVGVVVGLIIDQIVSFVWNRYADPRGKLARELNGKLGEIHRLIVDGSDDVQGLRARLTKFAGERAALRSKAVISLLQPQEEVRK